MAPSPDDTDPAIADTGVYSPSGVRQPATAEARDAISARSKGPRQVRSGDTLGRYELNDELGEGGMATVFRARDRELRRDVAIKVLFPHLARRPEIVHRFHREARAAAGLEHPNILRIYDVGEAGGAAGDDPPYIVMELVRGRTLLQEIEQRGAMLAEIAACIGALLADALAAAHAAGVIHRDIKPANALIAPGGRLLLGDFGVARLETEDSLVTRTGALLGTPAYMSPEQASGEIATARSDLYSLGATLYQLATGALPYSGPPAKVISMIATGGMVAPVRRRQACGADLSRLIERLMSPDPSARPVDARAIADELRGLAAAGGLGDASEELATYFEDPDGFLRNRTPTVVAAVIGAARTAMAEARLPRAMALADRASALAPGDPAVAALVDAVTDGGRAQARRRWIGVAGLAVALTGGAVALGHQLGEPSPPAGPPAASEAPLIVDGTATASPGASALTGSAAAPGAAVDAAIALAADERSPARAGELDPATSATSDALRAPVGQPSSSSSDASVPRSPSASGAPRAAAIARSLSPTGTPGAGATARSASPADAPRTGSATPGSPPSSNIARATTRPDGAAEPGRRLPTPVSPGPRRSDAATVGSGPLADAGTETPRSEARAPAQAAPAAPAAGSAEPATTRPPEAAAEPSKVQSYIVVRNYLWCNIKIDGVDRGNRRDIPLEVSPGHHVVRCVNPVAEWTQEAEVAPGATQVLQGKELPDLRITLAIDAKLNGVSYTRGSVVKLKPSTIDVIAGDKKQFIVLRESCTLKDVPELGCYRP